MHLLKKRPEAAGGAAAYPAPPVRTPMNIYIIYIMPIHFFYNRIQNMLARECTSLYILLYIIAVFI